MCLGVAGGAGLVRRTSPGLDGQAVQVAEDGRRDPRENASLKDRAFSRPTANGLWFCE